MYDAYFRKSQIYGVLLVERELYYERDAQAQAGIYYVAEFAQRLRN